MKRVLAVLVSAAVLSGSGVVTAGPRISWQRCEKALSLRPRNGQRVASEQVVNPHNTVIECTGHPAPATPRRPVRITNGPKILVTTIQHPTWTATEWASSVREQPGDRGVLATCEGVHHSFHDSGACGRGVNDDHLISLKVPADGTKCSG
ncbi:MAG TPA: alpha/beta hydrolase [Lentzea sp.]